MKVKDLLQHWQAEHSERLCAKEVSVRLPLHDAARIMALVEMFPGRNESDVITDLLSATLDEMEAVFPYVQGERVVAKDEFDDPVYEDSGPKHRFNALTRKYLGLLESELSASETVIEPRPDSSILSR